MTGLARQTCTGLDRVYGIKLDYTSFAARLSDAFKARERAKAASSLDDGGEEKGGGKTVTVFNNVIVLSLIMSFRDGGS